MTRDCDGVEESFLDETGFNGSRVLVIPGGLGREYVEEHKKCQVMECRNR